MYVVVVVLLIDGFHVPVMLFIDVVGNAEILAPLQKVPTGLKLGVIGFGALRLTELS